MKRLSLTLAKPALVPGRAAMPRPRLAADTPHTQLAHALRPAVRLKLPRVASSGPASETSDSTPTGKTTGADGLTLV